MAEPLRPLSTGELLDRTFTLYRQNFKLFVSVAIVGPIALFVGQMALVMAGVSKQSAPGMIQSPALAGAAVGIGIIFYLMGQSISAAASIRAVAAVYLEKAITAREAFAAVKGRVPRVIGVMLSVMIVVGLGSGLLIGLGVAIMAAAVAGGQAVSGRTGAWVGGAIGVIALIGAVIAAMNFAMRYALSVQACVVEDLNVGASMSRSVALTKGDRRRIVTVISVCTVIVYVLALAFGMLALLVPATNHFARQTATQCAGLIAGALSAPIMTIAMSLVYYDERVRKEAFDLQFLMESLDGPTTADRSAVAPSLG
jgi:hypothetical protein